MLQRASSAHVRFRYSASVFAIAAIVATTLLASSYVHAETLLSDDFTGTTIDTTKWTEVDTAGAGGTTGNITQNGTLSTANGYVSNIWGTNALVSNTLFASTTLEISAVMTKNSDQLLGYGDRNFQSAGTKAYIIDLNGASFITLAWENGSLVGGAPTCGAYTAGATYKIKVISTGFEVYKDAALLCTHTTSVKIDNKPIFLQSSAAASSFDDVLVTGVSNTTAPGAPTIGTATAGDTQATVTFTAPGSNGGSAITSYVITSNPGSISTTTASGATSGVVTGLTNGTSYIFTVQAVNAIGTSTASAASNAVTPNSGPTVPGAPTIGTATAGDTEVSVAFSAPASDGNSTITSYLVTASPGGSTQSGVSSPISMTGLTNGTAYTFTVQAVNAVGTSTASSASNSATPLATLLSETFTGTTINTSKWVEVDAAGTGGTTGNVQQNGVLTVANSYVGSAWGATTLYSLDTFASTSLRIAADMTATSGTFFGYGDYDFGAGSKKAYLVYITGPNSSVSGLAWNGASYTQESCGNDTSGSRYTLEITTTGFKIYKNGALACTHTTATAIDDKSIFFQGQTTAGVFDNVTVSGIGSAATAPGAPTSLTATNGDTEVALSWSAPASNGGASIFDYLVEYKDSASATWLTFADGVSTSTNATVTGLSNGTAYNFRVSAINSVGTSTPSSIATSTPTAPSVPDAPTSLTATSGNAQVSLSWSAPAANGSAITDYLVEYKASASGTWLTFADGATTTASTTVTSLTNNTQYDFRVSAVNSVGTSTPSSTATSTPTAPTAPGAPTIGTATVGAGSASVTFTAPVSNGGSAITGYTVTSSPGGLTGTGASSPITVTGLTNGVEYTFSVTATNAVGTSTASAASNAVTPTEPVLPTIAGRVLWLDGADGASITSSSGAITAVDDKSDSNLTATASGTASPTLVADAQNGRSVMRFDGNDSLALGSSIQYRTIFVVAKFSGGATFNDYNGIIGDSTGSSPNNGHVLNAVSGTTKLGTATSNFTNAYKNGYAVAGSGGHDFSPINTYWIGGFELPAAQTNTTSAIGLINGGAGRTWNGDIAEVIVYNTTLTESQRQSVEGYLSTKWGITVAVAPTAPGAISDLVASTAGPSSVTLTWTAPADNNSTISDYIIDYRVSGGSTWTTFSDGVSTATTTSVNILSSSTAYEFRVRAVNGVGTALTSNVPSATTSAPGLPAAPSITSVTAGDERVTVAFSLSDTGGSAITGYTITSSPGGITATGASSPIIMTGLTNGVTYTFTMTATNGVGVSAASAQSSSATPYDIAVPLQVTGLSASGANRQARLSWTAPSDGGDAVITDYTIEYKESSASTWSTFVHAATTTTKMNVTALENDTAYDFRVSAVNLGGVGTASAVATATPAAIGTLAFVITGESNSGGIAQNSLATAGELAPRSAVQIMSLTSGNFLFEDIDIGTNNLRDHSGLEGYYSTSHGLELQLTNSIEANEFPDHTQAYLVKTGHGGSQIAQWNVGGTYWTKFLQRTAAAKTQLPSDRQWVVWFSLGINDAIAGTATSTWKTAVVAHINKIKADLPGAIVVMTEFQSMPAGSGYPTYNAVIREIAAEQPDVYSVDSTGAGTDGANHWYYAGMKLMAARMATTTKTALGLTTPGTPTSLGATPGAGQMALSWTAPISNGGLVISDHVIQYKLSSGGTWSTFADGVSTATSATVTGLTGGLSYDFRVASVNANGTGNFTSTTATPLDSDAPVISALAASVATSSATITWTTNEQASSRILYGIASSLGTYIDESDTSPRVTSHSVSLGTLASCTTYYYRVISRDSTLNAATSSSSTFTTTGCTGGASVSTTTASTVTAGSGGTIALLDAQSKGVTLTVPTSFTSTSSEATFQAKQLDTTEFFATVSKPSGVQPIGSLLYNLKALTDATTTLATFSAPLTVTFSYSDADVAGYDEATLSIYRYDGSSWNALSSCVVDTTANTVTCETSAFSDFGLFGATASSPSAAAVVGGNGMIFAGSAADLPGYLSPRQQVVYPDGRIEYIDAPAAVAPSHFTRDLELGATGEDVKALQQLLNTLGFTVSLTGPGSSGFETTTFGPATKSALTKYQQAHNINPALGYFGPKTRATLTSAPVTTTSTTPAANTTTFSHDLELGDTGEDVKALQQFLNIHGFTVADTGPGSKGSETATFGYATQAALVGFQKANKISPAVGYFGPKTRALIKSGVTAAPLSAEK